MLAAGQAGNKGLGHGLTFLLQPLADLLVSDRYAPLPLLVIHGDRDLIVPCQHGQRLYEQAQFSKWM